jgi:hypothetical protein
VKAVVDAGEPDAASGVSVVGTVTDSTVLADDERDTGDSGAAEQDQTSAVKTAPAQAAAARKRGKARRKSRTAKRYYSKDECAICMDNFHRGEVVRILPCGHVFHKDECDEWLLKWRKLCPTCRADVTVTPNDLSASATLTPVVDPAATPPAEELAGSWRETLQAGFVGVGARAEAAATAVGGAFRAAVDRVAPRRNNVDERTPLLGTGASAQTQTPIPTRPNAHAP